MRLAGAFHHSASMVIIMRAEDGTFVDVNPAFERATGYRRELALGRSTLELDLWPDPQTRATIWARLRADRSIAAETVTFRARDGREFDARLSCEMFEQEGDLFVLAILQELSPNRLPAHVAEREDPGSYHALFQAAAEGLYRSLPAGGFIDVNPAMAQIFGYDSPAQMMHSLAGKAATLYVDKTEARTIHAELHAKDRIDQRRAQVYRRDGAAIWISENARAVRDDGGRVLFYEGSVIDISSLVAHEQALKQSEALYRTLVDSSLDGVFLLQHGLLKFANRALAQMLGYSLEELTGQDYMQIVAPDFRAAQFARRERRESGSTDVFTHELGMVRKDGTPILVSVCSAGVEYNGAIASTGTVRDITQARAAQRALEEAERKYRELFEHSVMGLFRSHAGGKLLDANLTLARQMGYATVAEAVAGVTDMRQVYADPAQRERLIAKLAAEGSIEREECALRRHDGAEVWVEVSARAVRDDDGTFSIIEGSIQDITARRAAELALMRSEARYRVLVDHSQVGVYIMREGRYVYANPTFASILGYGEGELIGKHFREILAPESLAVVEERFQKRQRGEPVLPDYETVLLRKDGSKVDVSVSTGVVMLDGVEHVSGTARDISKRKRAEAQLKYSATHDILTALPNRHLFQQQLEARIARYGADADDGYAVLFLDIDGFKLVNDSLGHAAGDRLLIAIAERLAHALRGQALVARYGGDEFTVLPTGRCDAARVVEIARTVLSLFEAPFPMHGQAVFSGASIGIVLGRAEYQTPDQVLRDADTAMYRAKARGKSGYVIFDEAMHAAARVRFRLENDLRRALDRHEFRVYYQPIVDLASGGIVGCEALARWQHPERGLLDPAEFLHVAEETGIIVGIDWWVLAESCAKVAQWQRRYPAFASLALSVNVDERQMADRKFVEEMARAIELAGIPPPRVSLEVTETVFRSGSGDLNAVFAGLKRIGVMLVVDDFGTGYSSLESFAASPFDALKIDRSFVHDVESNPRHRAIVRTISRFADDLGLKLTAEGVETPAQARLLGELGCSTAQGFLYSQPLAAEAMEQLLDGGRGLIGTHETARVRA